MVMGAWEERRRAWAVTKASMWVAQLECAISVGNLCGEVQHARVRGLKCQVMLPVCLVGFILNLRW